MTAIVLDVTDPYALTWPEEWAEMMSAFGYVATTRATHHADRDPALLCERLPWPEHDLGPWDVDEQIARLIAPALYGGKHGWGVLLFGSRGPRHLREVDRRRQWAAFAREAAAKRQADRLLAAIFGEPDSDT